MAISVLHSPVMQHIHAKEFYGLSAVGTACVISSSAAGFFVWQPEPLDWQPLCASYGHGEYLRCIHLSCSIPMQQSSTVCLLWVPHAVVTAHGLSQKCGGEAISTANKVHSRDQTHSMDGVCVQAASVAAMLRTLPYMLEEPAVAHASRLPSPQSSARSSVADSPMALTHTSTCSSIADSPMALTHPFLQATSVAVHRSPLP